MVVTQLPDTIAAELVEGLRKSGVSEVSDANLTRALYATDASLYRVPPIAVVFPRSAEEIIATFSFCSDHELPLTMRGAGTSVAGNAIGSGIVIDTSRYMNRVLSIDPERQTATVEPGLVLSALQKAAAPHGLRFGPDPSTANRCTIGGMIGNNACGSRALGYGKTSDNIESLDIALANGRRLCVGDAFEGDELLRSQLRAFATKHQHVIRREFGTFTRQASGYALESLLVEHKHDIRKLLCGSEGTLGIVLRATLRLVREPHFKTLVVLGYPSMADAADAVPALLAYHPVAIEGIDARLVNAVRMRHGESRVPNLPDGFGWLFVEVIGQTRDDLEMQAAGVVRDAHALATERIDDATRANALWQIRTDGAGLASRTPDGRPAYAGWEDAAVPPAALGAYLREFDALLEAYNLTGLPYGHFGDGCIHVRLDFALGKPGGATRMREFLGEAARLAVRHGGSLSGEHGDGRARGELLSKMYSSDAIALFKELKEIFDPTYVLNPGIIVDPPSVIADLRMEQVRPMPGNYAHAFADDNNDVIEAVHRCTGVGKCRADTTDDGGVMCPSYLATLDEKDSTRGRARVLQEMVNGRVIRGGWRSPEVREALELCLSCKSCSTECPAGVDMATLKSEALYQMYRWRLRPRSHYSLGWLPLWLSLASRMPGTANAVAKNETVRKLGMRAGGVDARRAVPELPRETFRAWFATHVSPNLDGPPVVLWVDTFTQYLSPEVGTAAVAVLEDAGYHVRITKRQMCCGLTWITTGQLGVAKKMLERSLRALDPLIVDGAPIVGLEPSCTAVLRSEAAELVGGELASKVAENTFTLSELLAKTPGWNPPDLSNTRIIAQPHCHHNAVMSWDADAELLRNAGAELHRLGGCCGLAGNFGFEQGHYEVSTAVAEHQLLPTLRAAHDTDVILADGFSCRTQIEDLVHKSGIHLAQLLQARR